MPAAEEKNISVPAGDLEVPSGRVSRSDEHSAVAAHTPTPWHLKTVPGMGPDGDPYWYIEAVAGARAGMDCPLATTVVDPECGILTEEDAAFIVLSANAHHGLVEALRALIAKHDRPHGFDDEGWYAPEIAAARAALKLTEG